MDYFVYKNVSSLIEHYAEVGVLEFFPSMIGVKLNIEPNIYIPALEKLVNVGVINRMYTNEEGSISIKESDLHLYDDNYIFIKYKIVSGFVEEVLSRRG